MSQFVYPPASIDTTGLATEAKQDDAITQLTDINTELDSQTTLLTSLDGKDFATQTTLAAIDTSLNNIEADISLLEDRLAGSLTPDTFDYIELTYVTVGNGIGEIETVVYKTGGAGGTTVATLTLAYDANDRLSTTTRT